MKLKILSKIPQTVGHISRYGAIEQKNSKSMVVPLNGQSCLITELLNYIKKDPLQAFSSRAYQIPVIFTSFGTFAPRSVSEGWIDWKTPANSPVAGSTFAAANTMDPLSAATF